ncbi:MAG TPA: exodeoxyribonuclease V subunit gamma, partial [Nocardioidaceae bacterium]|nr:exodeoxyribonuclease V subunit gamma [Nocardioidaceae bacterium]
MHRSERADPLVRALGDVLHQSPRDPFAADVVAVPAKGVERWLTQRLSHVLGAGGGGDGVSANIAFPSPASLVREAVATATGLAPDDDPWNRGPLMWTVLDVIDRCVGEDWCSTLAGHLGAGGEPTDRRRGGGGGG